MQWHENPKSSHESIFKPVLKLGLFIYVLILGVLCLSNFALFNPNWPFGLFASFMVYLCLVAPIVILLSERVWRKCLFVILPLAIIAFYPFYAFHKYERPTGRSCQEAACLSIMSANLHHDLDALTRLSDSPKSAESDLILLMDLPYDLPEASLAGLYPNHAGIRIFDRTGDGNALGSAIAIVSKTPVAAIELLEDGLENPNFNLRSLIRFSYSGALSKPANIVIIHPMMPVGRNGMAYRDQLIDRAITEIGDAEDFILLGDFNLTPWEPKFKALPGKRAGNPRWISTWDARKPWLRLAIDHVMIGREFETVEAEVMPTIGSDHYALFTVVGE